MPVAQPSSRVMRESALSHAPSSSPTQLHAIARAATASLHAELVLSPKPGLVCPDDRGSHDDMDATTMMRSLASLRHGFKAIVSAAADGASFARLQAFGIDA
ncbi:MAG: triphosphoribosyl-dephospho-CoA synthase, partial [Burkholderiaceae bacterium]